MRDSSVPLDVPFEVHEVLDSTSSEAQRLSATGRKAPFAVMARLQTAGRGRRGRGWSSTPGNLMMTVVVPASIWASTPSLESAPIRAAILVARYLRETFGIRVTLKWPNDILLGGRKLGGILCETSSSGSTIGDLLIGIGLNVSTAPGLDGPDAVSTTSLMDILGRQHSRLPELATIARELAASICGQWQSLEASNLVRDFDEFAIQPGHIVVKDQDAALLKGIDDTGCLVLEGIKFGTLVRLTSADQSWRWACQELPASPGYRLMVADVGNSRIKTGMWESPRDASLAFHQAFFPDEMGAVPTQEFLTRMASGSRDIPLVCHAVSVNSDNFALLARAAAAAGIHVLPVAKRPVRLRSDYAWAEIGADRVAAMEGFLARLDPLARGNEKALGVVVCAGTATTIDVVNLAGRHFGGIIMPGVTTALRSLHDVAPALPDLSGQAAKIGTAEVMAGTTRDAILGGEIAMTAGAIQLLIESALQSMRLDGDSMPVRVVFTGGHARSVMTGFKKWTSLRCDLEMVEHLVLEGARAMALGG